MALARFLLQRLAKCRPPVPINNVLPRRNFSTTNKLKFGDEVWMYRNQYDPKVQERSQIFLANFGGGLFWWWMLYHMWYEFEEIFPGEWVYIEPSTWSDEELGIPPDDYEE
ncbi:unnamed protein product [Bemisia tabaci]|uniref:NADH dehydrogenase [ubiquinone] 1 beta subcomplex subunit 2, mitochondrial n=1 Tax=Bemisia tabaci TaxID=7038 RepID=A0A9P0A905_BEMTA|nr:unnamed protein product [Bemisia tabaci]